MIRAGQSDLIRGVSELVADFHASQNSAEVLPTANCYPSPMPQASTPTPFRDGFAALWHEPLLLAADLTWRWCFGFSAWMLACLSLGLFLNSIAVSKADQLLLGTMQPTLVSAALQHMLRGSLVRFLVVLALLLLGLTLLWSFASAVGRAAILRRLIAMLAGARNLPKSPRRIYTSEASFCCIFCARCGPRSRSLQPARCWFTQPACRPSTAVLRSANAVVRIGFAPWSGSH